MRGLATLSVTIATNCECCEVIYTVCLCMPLNYVNLSVVVLQAFFGTTRQDSSILLLHHPWIASQRQDQQAAIAASFHVI